MSESSRPHGLQPTRLLHPWDFPGKSTGVGCHCLLHKQSNHDVKTIKIPVTVVRMPITIYCQPLLHQVLPKLLCIPISLILEENNSHPRPNRWINENEKEFTQGPKLICYLNNWNSPHMKNTDSFHQQFLSTYYIQHPSLSTGFPGGTPASAAFEALISGSRKIPWNRKCNPLQYSCLENSMDRGAWQASVPGVTNTRTWLSNYLYIYII